MVGQLCSHLPNFPIAKLGVNRPDTSDGEFFFGLRWSPNGTSSRVWDIVSGQVDFKKLACRIEKV